MLAGVRSALEFAQTADEARNECELNARFGAVVRRFGVRYFSSIVAARPGQPITPRVLAGEVDQAWTEHYARRGYAAVDPVISGLFQTCKPFTWREAALRATSGLGRRLFDEVKEFTGTDDALVIPIHGRGGESAAVILSGRGISFDAEVRPALHLAAVYFSGVAQDFANATLELETCPLTQRQLDCLQWVMAGKSDWEIGGILGISEHTVHNHVEAAKRTLDVGTRTQAFVHALRRGWLV